MPGGLDAFRRIQIGRETTTARGTAVAADKILLGTMTMTPTLALHMPEDEERNSLAMVHRSTKVGQNTAWRFESALQYETVHSLLDMAINGNSTNARAGSSGGVGDWTFNSNSTARNWQSSYTIEYGDDVQEYELTFGLGEQIEFTYAMNEPLRASLTGFGRLNTTGTFTASLVAPVVEEAVTALTVLYTDTAWANLGNSTADGYLVNAVIRVPTGVTRTKYADGSLDFSNFTETKFAGELELTIVHNTSGKELYDRYLNQDLTFFRLETLGTTTIGGSSAATRTFRADLAVRFTEPPEFFGNQDGENTFVLRGKTFADSCGHTMSFQVINTTTSL